MTFATPLVASSAIETSLINRFWRKRRCANFAEGWIWNEDHSLSSLSFLNKAVEPFDGTAIIQLR